MKHGGGQKVAKVNFTKKVPLHCIAQLQYVRGHKSRFIDPRGGRNHLPLRLDSSAVGREVTRKGIVFAKGGEV